MAIREKHQSNKEYNLVFTFCCGLKTQLLFDTQFYITIHRNRNGGIRTYTKNSKATSSIFPVSGLIYIDNTNLDPLTRCFSVLEKALLIIDLQV